MPKKIILPTGFFHVFNKSIAGFEIFSSFIRKDRFFQTLSYYNKTTIRMSFSDYLRLNIERKAEQRDLLIYRKEALVKILSYCIMPDHYHLLLRTENNKFLSSFISNVENSYTRYFNLTSRRKGPLWQSTFKKVPINTNSELLHVSRYIHLNPTTSFLVEKPNEWEFSSYSLYINNQKTLSRYVREISIQSAKYYRLFVENQIDYQRKLKFIKKHLI